MKSDPGNRPPSYRVSLRLAVALALAMALIPLWSTQIPPLLDYHNHLARQYILNQLPEAKYFQQFYLAQWHFIPYLAFDLIVQCLAHVMPVADAGKVFLSLLLLMLALAPVALNLALFGRVSPIALLGLLMVHNMTVSMGFVNYLFSVGFAVCLLALWIRCRTAPTWVRGALFTVLPLLLFVSHLLGFVIYCLTIGAYELGDFLSSMRRRAPGSPFLDSARRINLALIGLQSALPLGLYFLLGQHQPSGTFGRNTYGGLERKFILIKDSFSYLIPPYSWSLDSVLAIAIPVGLVLLLLLRRLELSRAMALPLAALFLFFMSMPMEFIGGWGADHRLLVPLGLVLIGSIDTTVRLQSGGAVVVTLLAAVVVVRVASVTVEWRKADAEYQEYVQGFDKLTDGSRVFYAFGHEGEQSIWPRPVYHLPLLALSKHQVYLPYLSVGSAVTLVYRPEVEPLQYLSKGPVLKDHGSPNWEAIVNEFDYFFLVNEEFFNNPVPQQLTPIYRGKTVAIYRGPRGLPVAAGAR